MTTSGALGTDEHRHKQSILTEEDLIYKEEDSEEESRADIRGN